MLSRSVVRTSLVAVLSLLAPLTLARAGEPGHPGSGTSGPPVPLGVAQTVAIAAKGIPAPAAIAAPARAPRLLDGKRAPTPGVTTPTSSVAVVIQSEGTTHAVVALKPLRLPTVSPALGPIPRPEWSHPNAPRKLPDYAVIDGQRVIVTMPAISASTNGAPR